MEKREQLLLSRAIRRSAHRWEPLEALEQEQKEEFLKHWRLTGLPVTRGTWSSISLLLWSGGVEGSKAWRLKKSACTEKPWLSLSQPRLRLSSEGSAHPPDQTEGIPFPLETKKRHCLVPQGISEKLNTGINSSSGNPPLKIICLVHCPMKSALRHLSNAAASSACDRGTKASQWWGGWDVAGTW